MNCWHCGAPLLDEAKSRLSFRAVCEKCNSALHCCINCKHYKPGLPNDCEIPGTDPIYDRAKNNFCEEFSILGKALPPKDPKAKQRFHDLFGDS